MRRRAFFASAFVAGAVAWSCTLVLDPDKLVGGSPVDAQSSQPDVSSYDGDLPGCMRSGPEQCTDGIDNDCNGRTDCEDPACGAFACAEATPPDWTPAWLTTDTGLTCPAGDGGTDLKVVAGDGGFACTCSCEESCTSLTIMRGPDLACGAGTETFAPTQGCMTSTAPNRPAFAKLTVANPTACPPKNLNDKKSVTDGRLCPTPPSEEAGAGCNATAQCMLKAPGFQRCIARAGNHVCPAGFPNRQRAGSNVTDGRECTGCGCKLAPCTGEIEFWGHPECKSGGPSKLDTTTHATCAAATALNGVKAYKAATDGGCTVADASAPHGTLAITDEQTICCP
jgi:hypothetical protein